MANKRSWKQKAGTWAKRRWWLLSLILLFIIGFANCLPNPLFQAPISTVLMDRNEVLLGARIAKDGQWRFPPLDEAVPESFAKSIIAFEDKRFYSHFGVDILAFGRALWLNISHGEVVSGGSTLSMQVIRLARRNPSRTIWEKLVEVVLATRLEFAYSKAEILSLYASYAPFGGNVVGIDAAAWKYFGRNPSELSWAEAATLAVLPNAPALIHPGRNRDALLTKRNTLLDKLLEQGQIDSTVYDLALLEELPDRPLRLPSLAPHLLDRGQQVHKQTRHPSSAKLVSTIDHQLQLQASRVLEQHYQQLKENGIHNAAVLIEEVATGEVLVYIGNTPCNSADHGCAVDIIPAHRSTGSIMKPFLYAAMLQAGEILPNQLIPDIPSYYSGYHPTNFDGTYQGAVQASKALSRSLNVPIVRMLQSHGISRFHDELRSLGMTSLTRPSSDYGLSLILGGAEASLWDLTGIYAGMARSLQQHNALNGRYEADVYRPPTVWKKRRKTESNFESEHLREAAFLEAGAIWHTFEAMGKVSRPEIDRQWEQFASSHRIAWKTGTSYGYRDAWAIGCTPEYVVGVWVGNADGEGRPGLIGGKAAAPIMLQMFDLLPKADKWFSKPYDDLSPVETCSRSGHRATEICGERDTTWIPHNGLKLEPCPYHQWIQLDQTLSYRLSSSCASPFEMVKTSFFVLPPVQESYFKSKQAFFKTLPPYRSDCLTGNEANLMALIYPKHNARIFLPVDLDGRLSSTIFEAIHQQRDAKIYWHLDEAYLGTTEHLHQMSLQPKPGSHTLTLTDSRGEMIKKRFEILEQK